MSTAAPDFGAAPPSDIPQLRRPLAPGEDRKTLLLVLGILNIIFGGFTLLGGLTVGTGAAIGVAVAMNRDHHAGGPMAAPILFMVLTYLVLGGNLLWIGIGSVRMRRWVRPVVLAQGSLWLALGLFCTIALIAAPHGPGAAEAFIVFPTVILFLIGLPVGYLVGYGGRAVQTTLEARDVAPRRFTDGTHPAVLALGFVMLLAAITAGLAGAFGAPFPIGPRALPATAARPAWLLVGLLELLCAVGLLWRSRAAWRASLATVVVLFGSAALQSQGPNATDPTAPLLFGGALVLFHLALARHVHRR